MSVDCRSLLKVANCSRKAKVQSAGRYLCRGIFESLAGMDFDMELEAGMSQEALDTESSLQNELALNDLELNFEMQGEIARGGMGVIYKGVHRKLQRQCAIKVLQPVSDEELALKRFMKEARLICSLDHPNIVKIFSVGFEKTQRPFFAMEWLEGQTLDQLLKSKKRLRASEFREIFSEVLSAVEYAHNRGIIHRDIKPSNIFLTNTESGPPCVKLLDFGIAKSIEAGIGQKDSVRLTSTGSLLGTPRYMSPEQCKSAETDQRTDIYSVAAVMYEALSGCPLFTADNPLEIMYKQINEPVDPLSLPSDPKAKLLNECILKGLSKNPAERYQRFEEFSSAIRSAWTELNEEMIDARAKSIDAKESKSQIRRTLLISSSAILLLGLLAYLFLNRPHTAPVILSGHSSLANKSASSKVWLDRARAEQQRALQARLNEGAAAALPYEKRTFQYYDEAARAAHEKIRKCTDLIKAGSKAEHLSTDLILENNTLHNIYRVYGTFLADLGEIERSALAYEKSYEAAIGNIVLAGEAARENSLNLSEAGQFERARKLILQLLARPQIKPKNPEYIDYDFWNQKEYNLASLAQTYLKEDRIDDARREYRNAIAAYEKTAQWKEHPGRQALHMVQLAGVLKSTAETDKMCREAALIAPYADVKELSTGAVAVCTAAYLMAARHEKEARTMFKRSYDALYGQSRAAGDAITLSQVLRLWGQREIEWGKLDNAMEISKSALKYCSQNRDEVKLKVEALYLRASVHYLQKNYGAALKDLEAAENILGNGYPAISMRVKILDAATRKSLGDQNASDAVFLSISPSSQYFKELRNEPAYIRAAMRDCANAYLRKGRKKEADLIEAILSPK